MGFNLLDQMLDQRLDHDYLKPDGVGDDWLHIQTPMEETQKLDNATMYGNLFWLRLKATLGAISKWDQRTDVMHIWVKPRSHAAELILERTLKHMPPAQADEMGRKLGLPITKRLGDGK